MASVDTTSLLPKNCYRHQNSSCCYNEYLIESNLTCAECPHGTIGFNCKFTCIPGYYGRLCKSRCQCLASQCHHVTGCIEGTFSSSNTEFNITSTIETRNHTHTRTTVVDGSYTSHSSPVIIHHSHDVPIVYFLMATVLSFFIFGFIVYIRSRKKNTKLTCCVIKHLPIPDVDSANCQRPEQEESIEASNFPHTSHCGIEEDDLYAEIRFSKLVDVHVADTSGVCKTSQTASGKGRYSPPRKSNNYQHCMFSKEYDHVHLKMTRSVSDLDDVRLGISNAEEYIVLKENRTLQKQCKSDDELDQQNMTFPRQIRIGNKQMNSDEHVVEASGFCKTSKAASVEGRYSSPRKNTNNQHCKFDKEYDHAHLKRTRSISHLDDYSFGMSNAEEYVVLKENRTLQKQCKSDDELDQQNQTFPRQIRMGNKQMDSDRPLSDGFSQLNNERKHRRVNQSLTGRPYSLVHGVSENVVSGAMEEASCLLGSQHECGRGENESSKQSDTRPYSFAMLLQ
ncbi:uncharacterized protein LOC144625416 [Crassostrea virginica]